MALQRVGIPMFLAGALLLSGCASKVTTTHEYSGFLGNYQGMQQTTSPSGAPVLHWVNPSFDPKNYHGLVYEPVVYYPAARPSNQVDQRVLDDLLAYTNSKLKAATQQRIPLVESPAHGVLIFRGAITAVNTSNQELKPYQLVPVALVISRRRAAAGLSPKDTNLYFEGELLDGVTRKPMVKIIRKGRGKEVPNAEQKVTMEDMKAVVDNFATDAAVFDAMNAGRVTQ